MKKIGFNASSDDDENEDKKNNTLELLIKQRYEPFGSKDIVGYKTSREILYELRELCSDTISDVTRAMQSLGFKMRIIDDHPHWIIYDKNIQPSDDE